MANNSLEKVNINNSEQWLLVQGKSAKAPLIIYVQAGPGLPIIPEADTMKKLLGLEENYLVAYWDQRGCGKSYNKNIDPETINLSQLTDDVIAVTKYMLKKYQKDKAILAGFSIGAVLSLMAAAKNGSIFSRIFLVGIDIDMPAANKYTLEFAMNKAKETNNKKFIRQIIELKKMPIVDTKTFQQRAKILTDLGGIKKGISYNQLLISTIKNMLFSKAYNFKDILRTIKGMEFCQNALLPEFNTLNLFHTIKSVQIPVHFIHGKNDGVAPCQMAVKYYEYLQADKKAFTVFENSVHLPHYDEPEKFAELLKEEIEKNV